MSCYTSSARSYRSTLATLVALDTWSDRGRLAWAMLVPQRSYRAGARLVTRRPRAPRRSASYDAEVAPDSPPTASARCRRCRSPSGGGSSAGGGVGRVARSAVARRVGATPRVAATRRRESSPRSRRATPAGSPLRRRRGRAAPGHADAAGTANVCEKLVKTRAVRTCDIWPSIVTRPVGGLPRQASRTEGSEADTLALSPSTVENADATDGQAAPACTLGPQSPQSAPRAMKNVLSSQH